MPDDYSVHDVSHGRFTGTLSYPQAPGYPQAGRSQDRLRSGGDRMLLGRPPREWWGMPFGWFGRSQALAARSCLSRKVTGGREEAGRGRRWPGHGGLRGGGFGYADELGDAEL